MATTNLNRQLEALGLSKSDLPSRAEARILWAETRVAYGFAPNGGGTSLLAPPDSNVKIHKNATPTWSLTLTPADMSGEWNVCTWSTPQCRKACVMWTSARGKMWSVRQGRLVRTAFLAQHPAAFLAILTAEVARLEAKGVPFGLRLNVASDILWERVAPWLFDGEHVRGYEYTKHPGRTVPANYRLTYSHSERWTDDDVRRHVAMGHNVAVVFQTPKHDLPVTHLGIKVIDGDVSDFRFDDPIGVIVGLAAKGAAKSMKSGAGQFVTIGTKVAA